MLPRPYTQKEGTMRDMAMLLLILAAAAVVWIVGVRMVVGD